MGKSEENKAAALALVNEGIRQVAQASIGADLTWDFFCECGAAECETTVELTLADYAAIHDAGRLVLASGHRVDERERVRHLREDTAALKAQAEQQVKRARRGAPRRAS